MGVRFDRLTRMGSQDPQWIFGPRRRPDVRRPASRQTRPAVLARRTHRSVPHQRTHPGRLGGRRAQPKRIRVWDARRPSRQRRGVVCRRAPCRWVDLANPAIGEPPIKGALETRLPRRDDGPKLVPTPLPARADWTDAGSWVIQRVRLLSSWGSKRTRSQRRGHPGTNCARSLARRNGTAATTGSCRRLAQVLDRVGEQAAKIVDVLDEVSIFHAGPSKHLVADLRWRQRSRGAREIGNHSIQELIDVALVIAAMQARGREPDFLDAGDQRGAVQLVVVRTTPRATPPNR